VAHLVEVPLLERSARSMALPESKLLRREVYVKELKGQIMVRKFLLWKSNKEAEGEEFPAYIVHFTDYSAGRKAPLAREVRITSSAEQSQELFEELKEENVKKGWSLHTAMTAADEEGEPVALEPMVAEAEEATAKGKKKAAKKAPVAEEAAKKKTAAKKPTKKTAMAESQRKKKKKDAGDQKTA
jgi:hypothetical protein